MAFDGEGNIDKRPDRAERFRYAVELKKRGHAPLAKNRKETVCHNRSAIKHRPRGSVITIATTENPRI